MGRGVGEGDADVLRLGAVDQVAENPPTAPEALAVAGLTAEAAPSAGRDARDEDVISGPQVLHTAAHLLDGADRLVAEDAAFADLGNVPFQDVQVGAADRD